MLKQEKQLLNIYISCYFDLDINSVKHFDWFAISKLVRFSRSANLVKTWSSELTISTSIFWFSESEAKFIIIILCYYRRNNAIKTRTDITAIVPHRTNLVKLFQVFLWFSLSIKLFLSCFKFWVRFIDNINTTPSSNQFWI